MNNSRALYLLLFSNAISGFAQGISMLAIPWYFTDILKDPSLFGLIYGIITLITIFWSLYAGTIIDRYPRKKVFMALNFACALMVLGVATTGYILGNVPVPLIVLVFGTTILNFNIHYPTLYAFGQEITEKKNYGKLNSMIEIQGQATSVFAGALATILMVGTENGNFNMLGLVIHLPFDIPKWELQDIFLMDGITYVIALLLIGFIKYTPSRALIRETGPLVERMKSGFNFLKKNPLLLMFGNFSYNIFVVLLVEVHLLLPMYVSKHLHSGADVFASAEIYYAAGALFAGFFIRKVFVKMSTILAILWLMLGTAIIFFITSISSSIIWFFIFSALIGVTNAGTRVLRVTFLLNHIPNNLMGRTGSIFTVINIILRSLLILFFSTAYFASGSNVIWAYFACGCFVFLSLIPIFFKQKELVLLKSVNE